MNVLDTKEGREHMRGPVIRISPNESSTALTFDCCCGHKEVAVDAVPDVDRAKDWHGTLRRVHRVDICVDAHRVSCTVQGLGHRLPVIRRVPLSVALGMGQIGDPLYVLVGER